MAKKNKKISNKKEFKDIYGRCAICGEEDRSTLHIHRIVEGCNGGVYSESNTIVICANCHAKIHAGVIEIKGKFMSTAGPVLIYIDHSKGPDEIIKPV